mgnify:FL=1
MANYLDVGVVAYLRVPVRVTVAVDLDDFSHNNGEEWDSSQCIEEAVYEEVSTLVDMALADIEIPKKQLGQNDEQVEVDSGNVALLIDQIDPCVEDAAWDLFEQQKAGYEIVGGKA